MSFMLLNSVYQTLLDGFVLKIYEKQSKFLLYKYTDFLTVTLSKISFEILYLEGV
jgi:hypothetical protein